MATAASIGVYVKALFIVLFWVYVAAMAYLVIFGDFISCFDMHSRWAMIMLTDFLTCNVLIGLWIAYKESSWIIALIVMFSLNFLGSLASLGYILLQFYKLSHEEYSKDPLYFVLSRRQKRDSNGGSFVIAARVIFSVLGCLVLGALIYTLIDESSPSYTAYFTSCFIPYAIDIYIHIVIFSVWIAYKESGWAGASFWIVLLVCFRGVTICAYILRQLFGLSPRQPTSLIIFKKTNRDLQSSDPLLKEHPN